MTPNDGTVNGLTADHSVTVANSAPVVTNVVIAPSSPTTNQTITATPTATDADSDTVTFTYQWQKKVGAGSFTNIPGATSASLDLSIAGNGDKGDELRVLVTPNDGTVNGAQFISSAGTVANSAPVVTNVVISPSSPTTNQTITATPTATDADSDTVTFTYQWQKKIGAGVFTNIAGETSASLDLATAGNGDKADELRVLVTPNDGTINGTQFTSSAVTVVNSAPVCEDVEITTDENTVGTIAPDCSDDDAETLGYSVTPAATGVSGTNGTSILTFDPNGAFEYLDDTEFATDASRTRRPTPHSSIAAAVDVTITGVNDAPVCEAVEITTDEDTVGSIGANCTDAEGDTLTYTVTAAAMGVSGTDTTSTLTYDPNGQFEYLADIDDETDAFTYKAFDGDAYSLAADVDVTINGVNDAPVCDAVAITTDEDTVGSIAPDCTDAEGDALTYSVTPATTGVSGTDTTSTLTFNPNGAFENLDDGEEATDSFTYTASDGDSSSVPADVDVTINGVNDAPVAVDDTGSTDEDTTLVVAAPGVLANDTDVEGDSLTVAKVNGLAANVGIPVTLASGAIVTLNADGSFTLRPERLVRGSRHRRVRHRQLHLPGQRRRPRVERRDGHDHDQRRQRRPGRGRRHGLDRRGHDASSSPPRACSPMTPTSRATA